MSLKKIKTAGGVTEYRLEANGLRVLHKFDPSLPLAALCVTYHVGSRNEASGHTGSTHILEHLLFKDSKLFNRENSKSIATYLEWMGASINATTWLDRTNYFELLPKESLEEAIAMEADRMRHSLFNDEDLAIEMPVVRNEYEIGRNNPFELLDEKLMETAFTMHPYRIPTIGSKEDIEASNARKLRDFYDTFYWPNNATLAVYGAVSPAELRRLVTIYFSAVPESPKPIPKMALREPIQKAPRAKELRKEGGVTIVSLLYKVVEGRHRDFPALHLGAMALGGGFSSRLERTLVDTGLAAGISVSMSALHDPGVLTLTAHVAEGADPKKVLTLMRKECRSFKPLSKEEVRFAKERILSELSFSRDGLFTEIRAVSEAVAAGDWTLPYRMEALVERISPAHASHIMQKYLVPEGETAGILFST